MSDVDTVNALEEEVALAKRIEAGVEASVQLGQGGANDTTETITKILTLRAQKAKLLGYPDYATYKLVEETATKPANVE